MPDTDTVIWRYLDLERFVALLHSRSLHLSRLDSFRDSWEGTWPKSLVDGMRKIAPKADNGNHFLQMSDELKKASYVSCWHQSGSESAALWDLYAGRSGVAIQSTVRSLVAAIDDPKEFYVGLVEYIDFDNEPPPEVNMLRPPFLKRKSFEHERELRVLHWIVPPGMRMNELAEPSHSLAIDPNVLIERLYLSPASPEWLVPAFEDLCQRFGLSTKVTRSSLYDPHVY